jgi:glyoxylate/hydroxypyruvate/2-ketogluconate reductase
MKPKITIARWVFDGVLQLLQRDFEVSPNPSDQIFLPSELSPRAADCDGLITAVTDRIDAAFLADCPRLKVISNIGVGVNNIDLAACTARGVLVCNTPDVLNAATADLGFALLLATARRITEAEQFVRAGDWKKAFAVNQFLGHDVAGATLGIIGMGRIGQAVARRAVGFDMKVLYCNRSQLPSAQEQALNASWVQKEVLLAQSDFVLLLVPYSVASHHLIGAAELDLMKPSAILINIARGGVVDDAALAVALGNSTIAGAGLDVFEGEPAVHPALLACKNVVLTPHIGSATHSTRLKMAMLAAQNLVAALNVAIQFNPAKNSTLQNVVNPEALNHLTIQRN